MKKLLGLSLLVASCSASAQFKCVDSKGQIAFQQTRCSVSDKEQKVRVYVGEAPKPVPAASTAQPTIGPYQRMAANSERERLLEERARVIENLAGQINYLQDTIARRNLQMSAELANLQNKKAYARNNLAGATWEQSISTEMQAITQKYKTMNDVDFERMRQLRSDLEAAKSNKK